MLRDVACAVGVEACTKRIGREGGTGRGLLPSPFSLPSHPLSMPVTQAMKNGEASCFDDILFKTKKLCKPEKSITTAAGRSFCLYAED